MPDQDDDTPKIVRPFADFLREQRSGSLHAELSEALQEITLAVAEHRKPGKLTLSIIINPMKGEGMVAVTDDVKPSVPQADRGAAYFYTDADGNLRREDPNQMKFETLREVETDTGEAIVVDLSTGEVKEVGE